MGVAEGARLLPPGPPCTTPNGLFPSHLLLGPIVPPCPAAEPAGRVRGAPLLCTPHVHGQWHLVVPVPATAPPSGPEPPECAAPQGKDSVSKPPCRAPCGQAARLKERPFQETGAPDRVSRACVQMPHTPQSKTKTPWVTPDTERVRTAGKGKAAHTGGGRPVLPLWSETSERAKCLRAVLSQRLCSPGEESASGQWCGRQSAVRTPGDSVSGRALRGVCPEGTEVALFRSWNRRGMYSVPVRFQRASVPQIMIHPGVLELITETGVLT